MLTQHCTDEELLRRAQQRDRSAFAELVHRYLPRIYLLTVSAMGDPGVATDVVCDAMTSAAQR